MADHHEPTSTERLEQRALRALDARMAALGRTLGPADWRAKQDPPTVHPPPPPPGPPTADEVRAWVADRDAHQDDPRFGYGPVGDPVDDDPMPNPEVAELEALADAFGLDWRREHREPIRYKAPDEWVDVPPVAQVTQDDLDASAAHAVAGLVVEGQTIARAGEDTVDRDALPRYAGAWRGESAPPAPDPDEEHPLFLAGYARAWRDVTDDEPAPAAPERPDTVTIPGSTLDEVGTYLRRYQAALRDDDTERQWRELRAIARWANHVRRIAR